MVYLAYLLTINLDLFLAAVSIQNVVSLETVFQYFMHSFVQK